MNKQICACGPDMCNCGATEKRLARRAAREATPPAPDMPIQHVTDDFGRPIQYSVPMWVFAPWAEQAEKNHGQSLERLRERGGLDSTEAVAILKGEPWRNISPREAVFQLIALVKAAENYRAAPAPPALDQKRIRAAVDRAFEVAGSDPKYHGKLSRHELTKALMQELAAASAPPAGETATPVLPESLGFFERECENLIRSNPADDPLADHDTRQFAQRALLLVREYAAFRAKHLGAGETARERVARDAEQAAHEIRTVALVEWQDAQAGTHRDGLRRWASVLREAAAALRSDGRDA